NYIDITQLITIYDDIAPTASNPASLQFSCIGDLPAPNINVVADAADNCSTPIINFESEVSDNNTCPETITRAYSVTDICGNSINVYQTIIIDDNINPTASNPYTLQISDSSSIPAPDINVVTDEADNCSIPTVAFVSETSDNQTCPETITRIYSITDDCGNSINVEHLIIVNDDVPPTASTPQSLSFTCSTDVPAPNTNVVTDASDNNSTPTVSFLSESTNSNSCPEIITRIYRVTDDCGNYIDVTQIIIIDDDIPPTASNPSDIEIYDIANIPTPDINVVLDEADNCAIPTVAFISEVTNNDTCQLIITRTYSVTDDCGNTINVSHDIIVYDNESPTATAPQDLTFSCEAEIPAPNINVITDASDNFSTATVTFVSDVSNEQTCPETITRTYRIIDECGNYLNVSHDIIINDDINPTASNPQNITVANISEVPPIDTEVVTDEADNCSIPTVEFVSETTDNQTCPETLTRIYSVTDACGNSINVSHNIIVNDIEAPTANSLNNLNLSCVSEIPEPDTSIVVATDNTSIPTVTHLSDVSDNNSCPETINRTYRVADDCGNYIDITQLFTIYDDIAPTASNPQTLQFACNSEVPVPNINEVTDATDNCTTPTVAFVSETSDNQICPETITRIYSVTDACGNTINVSQNILIFDDVPPTASDPQDIEVESYNDVPAEDSEIVIDETDNCSIPIVEFVSENIENFNCEDIITRIYSVTDACGNTINVSHTITVNHSGNPQPINLENVNLNCSSEIPTPYTNNTFPAITSNYVSVNLISETSDNQTCPETIIRTYSVTDECNNTFITEQIFIITDTIPPTASNLDTLTVDCLDNVPDPDITLITDANDNCSTPIISFVSDTHQENRCGGTITRIYSIADACGNTIDITQQINYQDTIVPELISDLETEITLYCSEVPDIPELEFIDNCSTSVNVYFNEEIISNTTNEFSYDVLRTWTVIDECANTSIFTQTIHMIVEYEENYESIELCIDEEAIYLNDFVDLNENGVWESESMDVLNNMVFDPYVMPEGDYTFKYTVEDNECIYIKDIFINVNDDCIEYPCIRSINDVDISVLVTPNGDLKNETFNVSYTLNPNIDDELACDIKTVVKLFNRWGTKVYESNDYQNTWRGESPTGSLGNSEKLPTGTYYYVVDLVNSGLKPIQGYILLGVEDK
ncbi:MAG: gliding motility-associated C-terminal domain-containing protein, partial [Flavobacteriaceae bacterium]|nr:gliding motility-associated C-terminal domain-containing protein [Flavobacteriaceae bacterium]